MNRAKAEELARQGRRVRPHGWRSAWVMWDASRKLFESTSGLTAPGLDAWALADDVEWRVLKPSRAELTTELAKALGEAGTLRAQLDVTTKLYEQAKGAYVVWVNRWKEEADESVKRGATITRLEGELSAAKAAAPQFKVGDRVLVDARKSPGTVMAVLDSWYGVQRDGDGRTVNVSNHELTLAPEAPAVPVEVWHPCSASEAREKHAAGMRVRSDRWHAGLELHSGGWSADSKLAPIREALQDLVCDTHADGWQWAEPEGGAK